MTLTQNSKRNAFPSANGKDDKSKKDKPKADKKQVNKSRKSVVRLVKMEEK